MRALRRGGGAGTALGSALLLLPLAPADADALELTIGVPALSFPSADPDRAPVVSAKENPVPVRVRYAGNGNWVVAVQATGDLASDRATIPASRIHWTASGPGFRSGQLSKTSPQIIGAGSHAPKGISGSLRFLLENSWSYTVGTYSVTITFTAVSF